MMSQQDLPPVNDRVMLPLIVIILVSLACSAHYPTPIESTDVENSDLSFQQWDFSSFCGLDLSGKSFSYTSLTFSIFQKVNLSDANFRGANVSSANFQFANLQNADFTGADLNNASFTFANMTGTLLDEKWAKIMPLLVQGGRPDSDLRGYDLRNVAFHVFTPTPWVCDNQLLDWQYSFIFNLRHGNLEHTIADGAEFFHTNLENANLSFASLVDTDFRAANLQGANLEGANLREADFWIAYLEGVSFSGANLSETSFLSADLRNADLRGAILDNADFKYADLSGAILTDSQQLQNAVLQCTIMPDGVIYKPEQCGGITPGPGDYFPQQ